MGDSASRSTERTVTVRVPLAFRRRGGRRLVLTPPGSLPVAARTQVDVAIIKAVARAFRWRRLIETGKYGTIEEIARKERINASYVARVIRLTLLAPDTIEAILDGRQGPDMTLASLMKPFPLEWVQQRVSQGDVKVCL